MDRAIFDVPWSGATWSTALSSLRVRGVRGVRGACLATVVVERAVGLYVAGVVTPWCVASVGS